MILPRNCSNACANSLFCAASSHHRALFLSKSDLRYTEHAGSPPDKSIFLVAGLCHGISFAHSWAFGSSRGAMCLVSVPRVSHSFNVFRSYSPNLQQMLLLLALKSIALFLVSFACTLLYYYCSQSHSFFCLNSSASPVLWISLILCH